MSAGEVRMGWREWPWRNAAVCLSAASLLFFPSWEEMYPLTARQIAQGVTVTFQGLGALWGEILLLGALGYLIFSQLRSPGLKKVMGLLAAGSIFIAMARGFSHLLQHVLGMNRVGLLTHLGRKGLLVSGLVLAAAILLAVCFRPGLTLRAAKAIFLILLPAPILFTWTIARGIPGSTPMAPNNPSPTTGPARPPKAIVLIFDELDGEFAFQSRPPWIPMPQFDRFAREYGSYPNCWPVAGGTYRSLPSLATGRPWLGAVSGRGLEVLLKAPSNGVWQTWTETDDLFVSVGSRGWSTRMVQWTHTLSSSFLDRRAGLTVYHQSDAIGWERAAWAYQTAWGTVKRSWEGVGSNLRRTTRLLRDPANLDDLPLNRQAMILKMLQDLRDTLTDRRTDLVWALLPCPHFPAFWDARKGRFLESREPGVSNLDNMAFADLILGSVREQMERQGDWDGALVVITSDHWQRVGAGENIPSMPGKYDHLNGYRVPLLVKWPGQQVPYLKGEPVCTLSVRRMVEAVAAGVPGGPNFPMDPPPQGLADLLVRPQWQ